MTAAQKTAKDKFKQAIAYRQKTGVSLKEAFAHIYGKKIANTRKLVFDYLEVPKGKVPKVVKIIGNINNFKANIWGIQLGFVEVKANNEIYLQLMDLTNNKPIIKFIPGLSSKEIDAYAYDISEYIKYYSKQSHTYTELESLKSKLKKWSRLIDKEVNKLNKKSTKMPIKKAAPKKKVAKKIVRKIVKKKAAPKKVAKKKLTKQDYDKRYQAKKPGKRTSASGNTYYENRANRSDKGRLLGIKIGNMPTYNDKDAAREIQIFGDNDFMLYQQRRKPILINLEKKYKKGTYDINKAAKLWRNYVDAALQKYHKVFGTKGDKWYDMLSIADRNLLSLDYAIETKKQFDDGEFIN